jgi:serine O-acetyltransferase
MKLSLPADELTLYCLRQINGIFPDRDIVPAEIKPVIDSALERIEACFEGVKWPHYSENGDVTFSHLMTDQYATFLYFMSNSAFQMELPTEISSKFYALNKALHSVEIVYQATLPEKFLLVHPVSTVLGRANYGNYLTVYQGVTVGSNLTGESPTIGTGVALFGGSRVIGDSMVGNNSMVSAGTTIINTNVPENTVAFMQDGILKNKNTKRNVIDYVFKGL